MQPKYVLLSLLIILLLGSILFPCIPARADGLAFLGVTKPDTSKFPTITTYLNIFNDQGQYITDLQPSQVSLIENGEKVTADRLDKIETPLNFVLAINSDPALAIRDGSGNARYDIILAALGSWASTLPPGSQDKLGLTWNGGVISTNLSPSDWKTRLEGFDPSLRTSTANLSALSFALDTSQQSDNNPGIKKTILLISSHLKPQDIGQLQQLSDRARQAGIRVFVWIVDYKTNLDNSGTQALQQLALDTGGQSIFFSGLEELPNLEEWFSSLRMVYLLTYTSKIRKGGNQTLTVMVNTDQVSLTSENIVFPLDLQPPSAVLLSPPIQITRQNPDSPYDVTTFSPTEQELSILVEFPDKRERPLKRTTLYVDGTLTAENTQEPFTSFIWKLSDYQASANHLLKVEIEDNLGLVYTSPDIPVQVTVVEPPGGIAGMILKNRTALTISVMVLAGAVLLLIIIFGGQRILARRAERQKSNSQARDPLTQPVSTRAEATKPANINPFPWFKKKEGPPPAYFARLNPDGTPYPGAPIPLNGKEITFGFDPTQSTIILDHPSLSPLHARLHRSEQNTFLLMDQNSIAGTWVNYERITSPGKTLSHGDIIHIGRLTFRFVLSRPPAPKKPTVTPLARQ